MTNENTDNADTRNIQELRKAFLKSQEPRTDGDKKAAAFTNLSDKKMDLDEKIKSAIYLAYLDMCRTLKGAKYYPDLLKTMRGEEVREFHKILKRYFENATAPDEKTFAGEYKKFLQAIKNDIRETTKKKLEFTGGQAQKVVNMAFKYLYCSPLGDSGSAYQDYFNYCHIPLDSFTLAGLKRVEALKVKDPEQKELKKALDKSWSKLEEEYNTISDAISKLFSEDSSERFEYMGISFSKPLDAELYMWPTEQLIASAKQFKSAAESLKGADVAIEQIAEKSSLSENEKEALKFVQTYPKSEDAKDSGK